MPNSNVPKNCLVVVATGAEAKLFRNEGDNDTLPLKLVDSLEPENLYDEEPSGSFVPEASNREIDEATFSKQLAQHLYDLAHAGSYDDLVLIADPDTLGEVRPLLHKEVTDKIVLELTKTLINSPPGDIEKSINAA